MNPPTATRTISRARTKRGNPTVRWWSRHLLVWVNPDSSGAGSGEAP